MDDLSRLSNLFPDRSIGELAIVLDRHGNDADAAARAIRNGGETYVEATARAVRNGETLDDSAAAASKNERARRRRARGAPAAPPVTHAAGDLGGENGDEGTTATASEEDELGLDDLYLGFPAREEEGGASSSSTPQLQNPMDALSNLSELFPNQSVGELAITLDKHGNDVDAAARAMRYGEETGLNHAGTSTSSLPVDALSNLSELFPDRSVGELAITLDKHGNDVEAAARAIRNGESTIDLNHAGASPADGFTKCRPAVNLNPPAVKLDLPAVDLNDHGGHGTGTEEEEENNTELFLGFPAQRDDSVESLSAAAARAGGGVGSAPQALSSPMDDLSHLSELFGDRSVSELAIILDEYGNDVKAAARSIRDAEVAVRAIRSGDSHAAADLSLNVDDSTPGRHAAHLDEDCEPGQRTPDIDDLLLGFPEMESPRLERARLSLSSAGGAASGAGPIRPPSPGPCAPSSDPTVARRRHTTANDERPNMKSSSRLRNLGSKLQKLNLPRLIDRMERDQEYADHLNYINREIEEEVDRKRMVREAEQTSLTIMAEHLEEFIDRNPRATYENWIEVLHPDNVVEGGRLLADGCSAEIDHRFYAADSDHRRLWNESLSNRDDADRRVYVAARTSRKPPSLSVYGRTRRATESSRGRVRRER